MSFEGYYQLICKNGHEYTADIYGEEENTPCPHCQAQAAWWHMVDCTNGSYDDEGNRIDGFVDLNPYLKSEARTCCCASCGNIHTASPATYHIPEEGHKVDD